jgi:phosphoribosyl 1,2-cyclic phosphate phosphodiesterase
LSFSEAVGVIQAVRPRRAYLVHLSHETSHAEAEQLVSAGIEIAWDGLVVSTGGS